MCRATKDKASDRQINPKTQTAAIAAATAVIQRDGLRVHPSVTGWYWAVFRHSPSSFALGPTCPTSILHVRTLLTPFQLVEEEGDSRGSVR